MIIFADNLAYNVERVEGRRKMPVEHKEKTMVALSTCHVDFCLDP